MYLYQQFFYLLIGLGILLGLPSFFLFSRGMWPAKVERAREVASRSLVVNFLCGLPLVGLLIGVAQRAGKFGGAGGTAFVILIGLLFLWSLIGVSGIAAHLGARLWPACTGDDAWRGTLRGGLVISGILTIPFLGWFILPLVLLTIGAGIRIRMWFVRAPKPLVAPVAPPVVVAVAPVAPPPAMAQPTA